MESQILPRPSSDPSSIPLQQPSEITFQSQSGPSHGSPISSTITISTTQQDDHLLPLFIHLQQSQSPLPSPPKCCGPFRICSSLIRRFTKKSKPPDHYNVPKTTQLESDSDEKLHPVIQDLRDQELGKYVLGLSIPLATTLMVYYNPGSMPLLARLAAMILSVAFAALWNGILLRKKWKRVSNACELVGVSLMLLVFYGFLAYHLPEYLFWLPLVCWVLSLLPFGIAFCCR
ncbi:hypothetical protein FNV43_RR26750 [Rhamnella rubrinervis]|uniref:Uncharacterized protein n=1 Tax=Rhamnella rubrinervis TaxID=2594499 RepID=A0A8K0GP21_9ROSA|nr:hypothetical protein FNV43_RR26750 [Rhamnella rubrinervis]